jgi:hypothetical protein
MPVITAYYQGSHITQSGDRNTATATQNGDNQISRVTQTALIGGAVAGTTNEATINQEGNLNSSIAIQNDMLAMPNADNTLTVTQTNIGMVVGTGNASQATQNGSNTHTIIQNN